MELIQSFTVDHTRLIPGIYTSRVDVLGEYSVTTYDIRLKRPNREPALEVGASHTLEHLIATYLRNDPEWKDEIVYWGPMGCLTGFYLILKGNRPPREVYPAVLAAFRSVAGAQDIPGAAPENCGNYLLHNLGMAKWFAREYVSYLEANADNSDIFVYPSAEPSVSAE